MSDSPEKQLLAQLDETLRAMNDLKDRESEIRRDLHIAQGAANEAEAKAQRLRMAVFALNGKHGKELGDANAANDVRRRELREEKR